MKRRQSAGAAVEDRLLDLFEALIEDPGDIAAPYSAVFSRHGGLPGSHPLGPTKLCPRQSSFARSRRAYRSPQFPNDRLYSPVITYTTERLYLQLGIFSCIFRGVAIG
jgi:hypothetical protein